MVSYVMESRKGRRSLVALLVALAIATVGLYLATSATATKPAKATADSTGGRNTGVLLQC